MSQRVLCKFFANGACLKGEHCEYLHDWKAPPNNVCTFYQKGLCAYGSRCRYEHVRTGGGSSSAAETRTRIRGRIKHSVSIAEPSVCDDDDGVELSSAVMCSFAAAGECPRGDRCRQVHGDVCGTCGKRCLHPGRREEREEHARVCAKRQEQVEALRRSAEIECSVCLERVLSKPSVAERKFGLMSECDHPFCISCIRNWRGSSPTSGLDLNSALRACPICRKLSYFVVPSVIWYSTKHQKQQIVDAYKSKLKSIDCKHFDFGNGNCPFGTSCFYKHGYRDGSLEEVDLRHLGNEDGQTVIAKHIRLSDFISEMHIR